jgi:hypothetical protein
MNRFYRLPVTSSVARPVLPLAALRMLRFHLFKFAIASFRKIEADPRQTAAPVSECIPAGLPQNAHPRSMD